MISARCSRAPVAAQHVEARAGHLHAALEVDDAQVLRQLPVRFRHEVERALLPMLGNDDIAALVGRNRHVRQGYVRHVQHEPVEASVDAVDLFIQRADTVAQLAHLSNQRLSHLWVLGAANLFRAPVELSLEGFYLGQQGAAARVERDDLVDRRLNVRRGNSGFHPIRIFPDHAQVEHGHLLRSLGNQ